MSGHRQSRRAGGFNIYVVLLDPAVRRHKKVRDANPRHNPTKPCVYVGLTGLAPAARFKNHKAVAEVT